MAQQKNNNNNKTLRRHENNKNGSRAVAYRSDDMQSHVMPWFVDHAANLFLQIQINVMQSPKRIHNVVRSPYRMYDTNMQIIYKQCRNHVVLCGDFIVRPIMIFKENHVSVLLQMQSKHNNSDMAKSKISALHSQNFFLLY